MRDLHSNIKTVVVVAAQPMISSAVTGKIVDLYGYQGCEFVITYGSITATAATILPVMKEGSVTGTLTSVADADMLGTELLASIVAATPRASGTTMRVSKRLGYIGNKRYVNLSFSSTTTAVAPVSAVAILNKANNSPVAT